MLSSQPVLHFSNLWMGMASSGFPRSSSWQTGSFILRIQPLRTRAVLKQTILVLEMQVSRESEVVTMDIHCVNNKTMKFWIVRYMCTQITGKWASHFLYDLTIKNVYIVILAAELILQFSLHFSTWLCVKLNHQISRHLISYWKSK